jgi:hypothetical protein
VEVNACRILMEFLLKTREDCREGASLNGRFEDGYNCLKIASRFEEGR